MITINNQENLNNPSHFENLSDEEKQILLSWIKNNLGRSDRIYKEVTSYELKDLFERSSQGFYITNGQFKGAMFAAEYRVEDMSKINWKFNIDKRFLKRTEDELIK